MDASVWIAFFERTDVFNSASDNFLTWVCDSGLRFYSPELALIETGCALARRKRDATFGKAAVSAIVKIPNLHVISTSHIGVNAALNEGCGHFLRGADAVYAAAARITGTQLITWDRELIDRAGGVTPSDWLARQAQS